MDIPTLQKLILGPGSERIRGIDQIGSFFSLKKEQYKLLGVFGYGDGRRVFRERIQMDPDGQMPGFVFLIKIIVNTELKIVEVEICGPSRPCRFTVIGSNGFRVDSGWMEAHKSKAEFIKMDDLIPYLEDKVGNGYEKALAVFVEYQKTLFPSDPNDLMVLPLPIANSAQDSSYVNPVWKKLYEKKECSDVQILVTSEGGPITIVAHKAILVASSEVFKSMLQTDTEESRRSVIKITDFQPGVIDELLKFLYLGQADLETYAIDLLRIADKYNIQDLVVKCEAHILGSLGKGSMDWTTVFELIKLYGDRVGSLKHGVKTYFLGNVREVMKDEGLRDAHKLYPDVYADIFFSTT